MQKEFPVFTTTSGLNNKVDPTRISDTDLAVALNVDLDDSGRISRRKNFTTTGCVLDAKGLYSNGSRGLFIYSTYLYLLYPDFNYRVLASGLSALSRLRCCTVNGVIYFVTGYGNGKVTSDVAGNWTGEDYVGPTIFRKFQDPPTGHLVCYFAGRMWIAQDSTLWFSEPFAFSWFDYARGFVSFSSRLRMIVAVDDGLFVSTEDSVYFLQGNNPYEMAQVKVHDYPVIEGTDLNAPGGQLAGGENTRQVAMWTSTRSICAGFSGGAVKELSEAKLTYPEGSFGSAAFLNNTYYVLINE